MEHFDVKNSLETMTLLVDTREQPTQNLKRRIATSGLPAERKKLNAGDYSCKCTLPDGAKLDFSNKVAIERKMSIEELCMCFGAQRKRFENDRKTYGNGCGGQLAATDSLVQGNGCCSKG